MKNFYIAIVILICNFGQQTISQIIYTDINPDSVLTTIDQIYPTDYFIDLDHDGSDDFFIRHHQGVQFFSLNDFSSEVLIEESEDYRQPRILNYGDSINSNSGTWYNSHHSSLNLTNNWPGKMDNYIGLKFMSNGELHYGWIRIGIPADNQSCVVKDFAYNSVSGIGIKAGETSPQSIREQKDNIKIILSNNNILSIYTTEENYKDYVCKVYSLIGNLILSQNFTNNVCRCNLMNFNNRVIFVIIKSKDEVVCRKTFLLN